MSHSLHRRQLLALGGTATLGAWLGTTGRMGLRSTTTLMRCTRPA